MKYFNRWVVGFLIIGLLIYVCSPGFVNLLNDYSLYSLRKQLIYLSGTLAFCLMTFAVILAARFSFVSKMLKGLDKAYFIHKSAGIFCLFFIIIHWLLKKAPHWLKDFYVIVRPANKGQRSTLSSFEVYLIKLGNTMVDYIFYVVVTLIVIALVYKLSYKLFRLTHKLFPLVYLFVAYHAATIQLKGEWFKTPSGFLLSLFVLVGCISACIALLQLIGHRRKVKATIEAINLQSDRVMVIKLALLTPINYQAGQFVFLIFEHSSEPHPFSIISFDGNQGVMQFAIKALGDFTHDLRTTLVVGQTVTVEGPYGELTFNDDASRHLYIAGGIGITPFITHLNQLAHYHDNNRHIGLWYCAKGELSQQFPYNLAATCQQAQVDLHYVNSLKNNDLLEQLDQCIAENERGLSIWFCGPESLLDAIRGLLKRKNISTECLHYDYFKMR